MARVAMQVDTRDRLEQSTITLVTVSEKMVMLAMVWEDVAATAPIEIVK